MFQKLPALVALLAVLVASAPGTSFGQERRIRRVDEPSAENVNDPVFVFKLFERAWREGNAQKLSAIASNSPIFVELQGADQRGGYFTKAQLHYILKDLFASTGQLGFEFVKYHNIEKRDLRVYGVAQRSYRVKHSGGIFRDKVYVTLVREGSRWAVAEIKSTW